jgi:nitrate reductase NapAB chaperone NapD
MLIKSFLVFPKARKFEEARKFLSSLPNAELAVPENSEELLVLIAENADQQSEEAFIVEVERHEAVDHIVLVSSFEA